MCGEAKYEARRDHDKSAGVKLDDCKTAKGEALS